MVSAPFCFGLQDVATKDWQSAAVEKRWVQSADVRSVGPDNRNSWSSLHHGNATEPPTFLYFAAACRYRSCFARVRQVTHETPSDLLDDTGQSRRSTRVRSQPDVFAPSSYSDDELATRCSLPPLPHLCLTSSLSRCILSESTLSQATHRLPDITCPGILTAKCRASHVCESVISSNAW